jgi:hypothetical protein
LILGFSALIVGAAMLYLGAPLGTRGRVAALGAAYLCKIIFFATLHFLIFTFAPLSYVFSSDVTKSKSALDLSIVRAEVDANATDLLAVRQLLKNPADVFRGLSNRGSYRITPQSSIEDRATTVGLPPGGFVILHDVYVTTRDRASCLSCSERPDALIRAARAVLDGKTPNELKFALERLSNALDREANEMSARISDLKALRPVWRNFDFLYFSTITETTVGYGDIIPTSDASRVAVMFQVTSGLFFLGFGLSFLWPDQNYAASSRRPNANERGRLYLQRSKRDGHPVTVNRDSYLDRLDTK